MFTPMFTMMFTSMFTPMFTLTGWSKLSVPKTKCSYSVWWVSENLRFVTFFHWHADILLFCYLNLQNDSEKIPYKLWKTNHKFKIFWKNKAQWGMRLKTCNNHGQKRFLKSSSIIFAAIKMQIIKQIFVFQKWSFIGTNITLIIAYLQPYFQCISKLFQSFCRFWNLPHISVKCDKPEVFRMAQC